MASVVDWELLALVKVWEVVPLDWQATLLLPLASSPALVVVPSTPLLSPLPPPHQLLSAVVDWVLLVLVSLRWSLLALLRPSHPLVVSTRLHPTRVILSTQPAQLPLYNNLSTITDTTKERPLPSTPSSTCLHLPLLSTRHQMLFPSTQR